MAENKIGTCGCTSGTMGNGSGRNASDPVYMDANRILDSCREKDCFDDIRILLPDFGQEIIDHASSVRARCAEIVDTCMHVSPMTFNRGFYQISIRIFIRMEFEVCVGGKSQCVEGLAIVDKTVILYGSEGNTRIFRSKANTNFCAPESEHIHEADSNLPTAVLEIVDPVVLSAKIVEKCNCKPSGCGCGSGCDCVPDTVQKCFSGSLCDPENRERVLTVSLGFFSVVRLERPAQFLVQATEYCVPDKECVYSDTEDPCCAFRRMDFPVEQFCPTALPHPPQPRGRDCGCGGTGNTGGTGSCTSGCGSCSSGCGSGKS